MNKRFLPLALLALSSLLFAYCSPSTPKANPGQATPGLPSPAVTAPAAVPTAAPTATPQVGKVLLIAASSTADVQSMQAALAELSQPAGLVFETRPALQQADLTPEIRAVVLLEPPANLADLAAAAPQTQFVAVSSADLPSAGNLTVIRQRPENQAFMAGYISVLLSNDYRGGGLLPNDGPLGDKLKEAFTNGAHYYCGVCAPGWPLKVYYPQVASLPAASDGPAWQAAAAGMFDNQVVAVYYLAPEAVRQEVIDYLQGKTQQDQTVLLVGAQTPPDALKAQWAATVRFDINAALRQAWPDVSAGKGGAVVDAPLVVENTDLLGAGRMRLVKDLLEKIKKGAVYPFTVPAQ